MAKEVQWKELEDLLACWKKVDFAVRQDEMDHAALQISEQKEVNLASRKALQEKTKAFQKLGDENQKLKEIGSLIKMYQKEVDALTKRAKFSETTFLDLYKWLREAPDPALIISNFMACKEEISSSSGMTEEVQALRKKLAEYESEFRDLKNQEVTIENLKLTIQQYQDQLQEAIKKGVEAHLQDEGSKQMALLESMRENEQRLQWQLQVQKEELRGVLAEHEGCQKQMLDLTAALDEVRAQKESVDMVLQNELESLAAKVELLELENSQLRSAPIDASAALNSDEMLDALQDELIRKDAHISKVVEQKLALEIRLRNEEQRVADVQDQLAEARGMVETLQNKLQMLPSQADFDRLQKQLQAMEDVERSLVDGPDMDTASGAEVERSERYVQRLKADLAKARVQLVETSTQLSRAVSQLEDQKRQVQYQAEVIQRLDADISKKYGISLDLAAAGVDMASLGVDPSSSQKVPNSGAPAAGPTIDDAAANSGLVRILVGQRDQLKTQIKELESEKQQLDRNLRLARSEIQELKTDNLTLYGKVRYLANGGGDKSSGKRRALLDDEELDLRYRRQYDEAMTYSSDSLPSLKDRDGQVRLSTPERITLSTARIVLSTRYGRYGAMIYIGILHFLIMAILYKLSHGAHMPKA